MPNQSAVSRERLFTPDDKGIQDVMEINSLSSQQHPE